MITLTGQCTKPGLNEHWFKEIKSGSTADNAIVGLMGPCVCGSDQAAVIAQGFVETPHQGLQALVFTGQDATVIGIWPELPGTAETKDAP